MQDYSDVMAMQIDMINIPESIEEDNCGYDFKRNNNQLLPILEEGVTTPA